MHGMLSSLPSIRHLLDQHGLSATKDLGQHFLLDHHITDKIAKIGVEDWPHHILEIGPGPGGLTRSLCGLSAQSITVIERDKRFVPLLEPLGVNLMMQDALKVHLPDLLPSPRRLVANLPYNISTPLLVAFCRHMDAWDKITILLQLEVADRLAAVPNSKEYGRLSVIVQAVARVTTHFKIHPSAFVPPPKVWSRVISLEPRTDMDLSLLPFLEQVTQAAFSMRRKMLKSGLKSIFSDAVSVIQSLDMDPNTRPENVPVHQWLALAHVYRELHGRK
jgi:16S rRNA (adenine1518-N6/adenine1519-N6)-dimethyltransferase